MSTVNFMAGYFSPDMLGSCMYVCAIVVAASEYFRLTCPGPPRRCTIAPILVSAMASVGTRIGIASLRCVAARVRTRRNAGKLSWKRKVFGSEVEGRFVY
jgi:hypothetical protein